MNVNLQERVSAEGLNWSFSKLIAYESCPMRFRLRYIHKLPEPEPAADNPMERGTRIHNRLEAFVKGEGPMDTEARGIGAFVPALEHLQALYAEGMAHAEDNWFYDENWNVTTRDKVWLWSKLDFIVLDDDCAVIGDYKSGRSAYKAVEHIQQMQMYAANTALRYENVNNITVELWYVDEGTIKSLSWTREEALKFVGLFDKRAQKLYQDTLFRPNPNVQTCKYCPYSPRGTGACPVGV